MKEDLNLEKNQYSILLSMFTAGYVEDRFHSEEERIDANFESDLLSPRFLIA